MHEYGGENTALAGKGIPSESEKAFRDDFDDEHGGVPGDDDYVEEKEPGGEHKGQSNFSSPLKKNELQ